MGRQTCGGGNSTATSRSSPAAALADVVPIVRVRRPGTLKFARDWIRLRQEAAAGGLSPRPPAAPPAPAAPPDHPSCGRPPENDGLRPRSRVGPPDDAA